MARRLPWCAAVAMALALVGAGRLDAGGWAVVTVRNVPGLVIAGEPVTLTYAVRQHGTHLTPGLAGYVEAKTPQGAVVRAAATPAGDTGYYVTTLTLPQPGDWTMNVESGFLNSATRFPLRVVDRLDHASKLTDAEKGRMLLAAKGCLSCHRFDGVSAGPGFAPDLTTPRYAATYLKSFLADPSIKPPSRPGLVMPDLQLSLSEIATLATFLGVDAKQSTAVR
jgi:mono/diheme cytochrome c family protein